MRISIIVPYTTGFYMLEDCLWRLQEQEYKDFEVIVIQDQIPSEVSGEGIVNLIEDPTELIRKYSNDYDIKYIVNEEHKGVAFCRNLGVQYASGEYVYFLDMDDYLMQDTLQLMVAEIDDQNVDLIYGNKQSTWYKKKVFFDILREKMEKPGNDTTNSDTDTNLDEEEKQLTIKEANNEDKQLNYDVSGFDIEQIEFIDNIIGRRKGLLGISALHIMIKRSFLIRENIYFCNELFMYSDAVFVTKLITKAHNIKYVPEALYIKRKRNNPVQYPALSQMKNEAKFDWYITAYTIAKQEVREYTFLTQILDQKVINFYCESFALKLRRSENDAWRHERFTTMCEIAKQLSPHIVSHQILYKKILIHLLQKGNLKRSILMVNLTLGSAKAKKVLHNRKLISTYLYYHYFSKLKLKTNYVMCESFLGRNYADSPKNIYEYMSKHYPQQYKFIWSVDKKTIFPYPCTKVKRFGIRYAYYLARSKYFVFNMRQPMWMQKREGQVFLNLGMVLH